MVSKERLREKIEKTAGNLTKGIKKAAGKGRLKNVPPHRHCRMCNVPIDLKRDPAICGEDTCAKDWKKNKKNEKMVRIAFFVFAAVFLVPIILQGFSILG